MTALPAYQPDKDDLRARLDLFYVSAKLGIVLDREGRGLCPFHADTDPSFRLFDGDDGVQRWWCFPCGIGGDLFDLIRGIRNVTFPEALQIAATFLAELPPDYQPPPRALPAIRHDPEQWHLEILAAQQRAAQQPGILAALTGYASVDDPRLCSAWDVYLRGTWGWGINENGAVLMPHWHDGVLTGCKLRTGSGDRQSLPGSRYEALYGSWLGRRHQDVLLAEGETDAAYVGWVAANERIPLDVFALPAGASAPIDPAWLTFLQGVRTLYLAFDPDSAGVEATRAWITELNGTTHFRDVRVCCLPLGRDLRAARPDLRSLLQRARRPLPQPDDIVTAPGGYVRLDRQGQPRAVTTWTVEPVAQLVGGEDPGFEVRLSSRGSETTDIIRHADLGSPPSLKRWANKRALFFTGSDADVQSIAKLVAARGAVTPEIFQTAKVGLHSPPADYAFAGPSVVFPLGYEGQLPWRYTPNGKQAADVSDRVLLPTTDALFQWSWLRAFIALSDPSVTHPILAWVVAAARRPEVQNFPLLFIGGSSGVGKSTLARLASRLAGSAIEIDLAGTTKFVLLTKLASTTSLPVFVDEWTAISGKESRLAFKGYIPTIYTGGIAERGQADLSTTPYWLSSPIIVAGEDTFVLDRENERMVSVVPSHRTQNHKALAHIQGAPLERFGQQLSRWLCDGPALPPLASHEPTRAQHNRAVLLGGWQTLHAFLDNAAAHGEQVPDIPAEPDLSCFEQENYENEENVYMLALQEGFALRDGNGLPLVWNDPDGQGTWVRGVALLGELQRRQIELELPGGSRAMLNYFRERHTVRGDAKATIPPPLGVRVRAHLIEGLLLSEEDDDAPDV